MSFPPIVQRELALASRRSGTYWTRFGSAATVAVITLVAILNGRGSSASVARGLFMFLEVLTFLACMIAGVRYTADALSMERREGTLGLLFLTDLKGYDVVLGKLVVFSLDAVFTLLAICPVLAIPLMLGGISGVEFQRLLWLLCNTLLWSLSVGMLVSSLGYRDRNVTLGTLFVILLWSLLLPLAWKGVSLYWNPAWLECVMLWPSPGYAFMTLMAGAFGAGRPLQFWWPMATVLMISLACLSVASFLLPRLSGEGWLGRRGQRKAAALAERTGGGWKGFEARAAALNANPVAWLAGRGRGLAFAMWIMTAGLLAYAWWIRTSLKAVGVGKWAALAVYATLGLHFLVKLLVAAEACRRLNEDRRSGAMELLLCTPMNVAAKATHACATRVMRTFLPVVCALAVVNFSFGDVFHDEMEAFVGGAGAVILLFDCLALVWLGMWRGLEGKPFGRTTFFTFMVVMVPPWAVFILFMVVNSSSLSQDRMLDFFRFWFVGSAIYDLGLAALSRWKLMTRFRARASGEEAAARLGKRDA